MKIKTRFREVNEDRTGPSYSSERLTELQDKKDLAFRENVSKFSFSINENYTLRYKTLYKNISNSSITDSTLGTFSKRVGFVIDTVIVILITLVLWYFTT